MREDIITAASTPYGGAIAVIRLSGRGSKQLLRKLCNKDFKEPRRAYYTTADTGTIKDKCVVIFYEEGKSYTGEESGEVYCHGSAVIAREITEFFIRNGARAAEGGEFTMRAYLNKKLDLTEAEGVLDLINAETVEQARDAFEKADGKLCKKIRDIQKKLADVIAKTEVSIDYPEEDIESFVLKNIKNDVNKIKREIEETADGYSDGRKIKEGIKVVIFGKPNVGKSSLFNALMEEDRAIVNEREGTTRDVIDGEYVYKGRKFVLYDTAGIRNTDDGIESEGIKRAFKVIDGADVRVFVKEAGDDEKKADCIVVTNKCDIKRGEGINVSAVKKEGINILKEEIYRRTDFVKKGITVNLRQYSALIKAKECLKRAIDCNLTMDCVAADLTEAYDELGRITSVIGSDEIIDKIFSSFCVGK